jgi:hypothetical protein
MWKVAAWGLGRFRALTILQPTPGGLFCLAFSALSDIVADGGQLGPEKLNPLKQEAGSTYRLRHSLVQALRQ